METRICGNEIQDRNITLLNSKRTFAQPQNRKMRVAICQSKRKNNQISTTKYSIITFLPLFLIHEIFGKFTNLYFLINAVLQSIPAIRTLSPITIIAPLMLILLLSFFRELWEDLSRYKMDKSVNNSRCEWFDVEESKMRSRRWKKLKEGHLIVVKEDEQIPADIILLHAMSTNGYAYVETANLDGERNLKFKSPVLSTRDMGIFEKPVFPNLSLTYRTPDPDIYFFEGVCVIDSEKYYLDNKNFIPRGVTLKNTRLALGLVVYVGKETKLMLNHKQSKSKMSTTQCLMNRFVLMTVSFVMLLLLIVSISSMVLFKQNFLYFKTTPIPRFPLWRQFLVDLISYFTLFNSFIPISLVVSIETVRMVQLSFFRNDLKFIKKDEKLKTNTTTLNEELGKIEFLLTDKTGTLTCNEMEAKYFCIGDNEIPLNKKHFGNRNKASGFLRKNSLNLRNIQKMIMKRGSLTNIRTPRSLIISQRKVKSEVEHEIKFVTPLKVGDGQIPQNKTSLVVKEKENLTDAKRKNSTPGIEIIEELEEDVSFESVFPMTICSTDKKEELVIKDNSRLDALFLLLLNTCHDCFPETIQKKARKEIETSQIKKSWWRQKFSRLFGCCRKKVQKKTKYKNKALKSGTASKNKIQRPKRETNENENECEIKIAKYQTSDHNIKEIKSEKQDKSSESEFIQELKKGLNSDLILSQVNSEQEHFDSKEAPHASDSNFISDFKQLASEIKYSGASPDEICLLTACKDFFKNFLIGSNEKINIIQSRSNRIEVKKLLVNDFDSERKMMSVLIKRGDKGLLMCKGADQSIISRLKQENYTDHPQSLPFNQIMNFSLEKMNSYCLKGYRTLLMAIRLLSKQEMKYFIKKHQQICELPRKEKKEEMSFFRKELEKDLILLGCSAVEDKLQEGLKSTIKNLRRADMNIWVLTGDKLETAENIAISSGLFSKSNESLEVTTIRSLKDVEETCQKLKISQVIDIQTNPAHNAKKPDKIKRENILINGNILTQLYDMPFTDNLKRLIEFRSHFEEMLKSFKCVVFCRTTPKQKSRMVEMVRSWGKITLAIGDGANDVNMIQAAHVGVGIAGKEGRQAVNLADFGIHRFRDLERLLFYHGRLSYKRLCFMIQFFFYKNVIFTFNQFLFTFTSLVSRQSVFFDWYVTCFSTLFTTVNLSGYAIQEQDLSPQQPSRPKRHLMMYYKGQHNLYFSSLSFLSWAAIGLVECTLLFGLVFTSDLSLDLGKEGGYISDNYDTVSICLYMLVIFQINLKLALYTRHFTSFLIFVYIVWGPFMFYLYMIVTSNTPRFNFYMAISLTHSNPKFLMTVLLGCASLFIFNMNVLFVKYFCIFRMI